MKVDDSIRRAVEARVAALLRRHAVDALLGREGIARALGPDGVERLRGEIDARLEAAERAGGRDWEELVARIGRGAQGSAPVALRVVLRALGFGDEGRGVER